MLLTYTLHAQHVMEERGNFPGWEERAVAQPDRRMRDPHDDAVKGFYLSLCRGFSRGWLRATLLFRVGVVAST